MTRQPAPSPTDHHPLWMSSPFIRKWVLEAAPHLTSESTPEAQIVELLFTCILAIAARTLPEQSRFGGLTAGEVASELIDLVLSGRFGGDFDTERSALAYLAGAVRTAALAHNRTQRRRASRCVALSTAFMDPTTPDPLDITSTNELLGMLPKLWGQLSELRREAIQAQLGVIVADDARNDEVLKKNHAAKHHGIMQLRHLFEESGAVEM